MPRLQTLARREAGFIEPMECLAVPKIPEGSQWVYEIKFDGYRAIAVKSHKLTLFSRTGKLFHQFPLIKDDLALPDNTVIDGEIVALDESGRPSFNLLQNARSKADAMHFYVFDILVYKGRDLTHLTLVERRAVLRSLKFDSPRVHILDYIEGSSEDVLHAIREQKLEGIIAKRKDRAYEIGKRSGAWVKHRLNRGQELVIGGFVPGTHGLDSIIVGYYRESDLIYVARVRNGFVPRTRRLLFDALQSLIVTACPFANLPETGRSRFGDPLTAEKMKKCVWVQPEVVAQIEFLEWTGSDHLRHSKFAGLRNDKDARDVVIGT
jgi:bifunctional non-homologous end joining protein LigD